MRNDCVVGDVETGAVRLMPRELLCLLKTAATVNLTPNYVSKTFRGGPHMDKLRTSIRQGPCQECNHPDTLYLGHRMTSCNVCGGSGVALRLA